MSELRNGFRCVLCRVGVLLMSGWLSFSSAAQAGEPVVMGYDRLRQLVLDTRVVQSLDNAKMTPGRVEKDSRGVLFPADRPWENATNNLFPNVWFDVRERLFKLWYKCVLHDADVIARMDGPTTIHEQGWYLLHATSSDGLSWTKPDLGLHSFAGSKKTNIVTRDTPNAGVMFDAHDSDAARRFKMIYDVGPGKLRTQFSADGVRWSEPVEPQGFGTYNGDTHNNAFWDERLQKYVLFSRAYLGERLVARFESDDFQHWKSTGVVMRSSASEGRVTQTYCMPAFAYGNVYFGYLMMYHPGRDRAVDCELAWSPDSITWQRISPGQPLIPRGERGSGDSMCIYGPAGPAIAQDGRLLIFYGGSDESHRGWKRHCLPMLARLPVDGFVGCEPLDRARPAILTTQPMLVSDEPLTVSANVMKGALRVRVLDAENFSSEPSDPITQSGSSQRVTFSGRDQNTLRGKIIRLQFELDRATLFGFRGLSQLATPTTDTGVRRFDHSLTVTLAKPKGTESATLRYTLDGREPTLNSDEPKSPITLTNTTRLRSRLFWQGVSNGGPEFDATFLRREPPKVSPSIVTEADSFDTDASGWLGVDAIKHHPDGGLRKGFVRLSRGNNLKPFARLSLAKRRYAGDWPKHFGGEGVTISFALRGDSQSGKARIEILAGDTGAWYHEFSPTPGPDWQTWSTTLRWDWNDAEAAAAGWTRSMSAFSWSDTMRHVGQLVVMPSASSQVSSFDLDDFSVTTSAWAADPVVPQVIRVAADAPETTRFAAIELQRVLKRATGAEYRITHSAINAPAIRIDSDNSLPQDGFVIRAEGRDIVIAGNDALTPARPETWFVPSHGSLYGTQEFLERYVGVRWLMPGELGEDVPKHESLSFAIKEPIRGSPSFAVRMVAYLGESDSGWPGRPKAEVLSWMKRQRLTNGFHPFVTGYGHSWDDYILPADMQAHPEWKSTNGEAVRNGKVAFFCTTAPGLVETFARRVIETIDRHPTREMFSISPTDGGGFCSCERCSKLLLKDTHGKTSHSLVMLTFYKQVAEIVQRERPGKRLGGFVYYNYQYPPPNPPELPDNLSLCWAPLNYYGYGLLKPTYRTEFPAVMRQWRAITPHFYYHNYSTWMRSYHGAPLPPSLDILKRELPTAADQHAWGARMVGTSAWGVNAPINYLLAKQLWNAKVDVSATLDEWLQRAYGPGWKSMRQVFDDLDAKMLAHKEAQSPIYKGSQYEVNEDVMRHVYAPLFPSIEQHYRETLARCETEPQRRRLAMFGDNLIQLHFALRTAHLIEEENPSLFHRTDAAFASFLKEQESGFSLYRDQRGIDQGPVWKGEWKAPK